MIVIVTVEGGLVVLVNLVIQDIVQCTCTVYSVQCITVYKHCQLLLVTNVDRRDYMNVTRMLNFFQISLPETRREFEISRSAGEPIFTWVASEVELARERCPGAADRVGHQV